MNKTTAEKVKELRISHKLTLKTLSEASGLSIGHLSQFERGHGTMSIHSLERVAVALGVQLSYFIESSTNHDGYLNRSYNVNMISMPDSRMLYNQLGNRAPDCVLEPMLVTILPRAKHVDAYPKPHDGEEFIYVLEGVLTVLIDDETHRLYPGDSMHYLAQSPHEWLNDTANIVRLVSVNTPRILPV